MGRWIWSSVIHFALNYFQMDPRPKHPTAAHELWKVVWESPPQLCRGSLSDYAASPGAARKDTFDTLTNGNNKTVKATLKS